ncbi:sugar ABC transporter permease [Rhodoferax sp.]|uniref:carbohydrate ABC transporter permease n=1 Tax=Rhodoferax sp. TaxID=50421 RepID=UPI00262EB1D0|nr:sugar ABC transporter permease [Rhodoferax sp.]MDD2920210.1 sugar ABC transporter permease [Rhodoferax sp.]
MKRSLLPRLSPKWAPYVFLSPFVLLFVVFGIFPLTFSFLLAFQSWEPTAGLSAMKFVGLENFIFTLQDEWFWKSLKNTFWLATAAGVPQHLVAIPLAFFIHSSFKRSRNAVVGIYFLPYITSTVAIAMMFSTLFSTDYGMINQGLQALHHVPVLGWLMPAQPIDWLNQADNVKPAISLVVFWRYLGFNTVLYLAALQTIPGDIYEAATMDGAGRWQKFWFITLPSLKPMIYFGVTLSVIGGLQLFEEPFILTGGRGGTDQAGMTTAMYMYRTAFEFNDFGTASALSWLLFVFVALLTWLTNRVFRSRHDAA